MIHCRHSLQPVYNAIADAVASFESGQQTSIDRNSENAQQRLIAFVTEHRRIIDIAIQAFAAIKTGNIGVTGATGKLLVNTLAEIRSLPQRTLPEIPLGSPNPKAASA